MMNAPALVTTLNVEDYFRGQLTTALAHRELEISIGTADYLVRLLSSFADPALLFTRGADGLEIKPLAMQFADAVYADGPQQRKVALKRLGDIALFIAGMFSRSLARKVVDVDYYIAMGGAAYRDLNAALATYVTNFPYATPFGELARKFSAVVDVLGEVADESHLGSRGDTLRDFEIWLRTGSKRALGNLHSRGVFPSRQMTSLARH